MAKNPGTIAAKWVRSMQGATQSAKDGAAAVTVAPGQKAAAAAELYRRRVNDAVDQGRFQEGCQSVSLAQWQQAYISKGVPRISSGATDALPKVTAFMTWLLPITENAKATVASMPKGTIEDSANRMLANMRIMAAQKYKGRR